MSTSARMFEIGRNSGINAARNSEIPARKLASSLVMRIPKLKPSGIRKSRFRNCRWGDELTVIFGYCFIIILYPVDHHHHHNMYPRSLPQNLVPLVLLQVTLHETIYDFCNSRFSPLVE